MEAESSIKCKHAACRVTTGGGKPFYFGAMTCSPQKTLPHLAPTSLSLRCGKIWGSPNIRRRDLRDETRMPHVMQLQTPQSSAARAVVEGVKR